MSNSSALYGIENSHLFQSTLLQAFETTYIIEKSNSPDTVVGRSNFLNKNFEALLKFRESPRFNIELQEAVDRYKQTYYDKVISDKQAHIIIKADWKYLMDYFFDNITRSFYKYLDKNISEIGSLKKQETKQKRKSQLHEFVVNQNPEILALLITQTDKEIVDKCFTKAGNLQKDLYNYINLKLDGFDEWVLVEVNEEEYEDENKAPISELARKMVKEIKSKLYLLQFDIRNQSFKIKLKVTGINNVALTLDEKADESFKQKIISLFK